MAEVDAALDAYLRRYALPEPKKPKPVDPAPKAFKTVAPPANPERKRLAEGEEVAGTGGARSVKPKPTVDTEIQALEDLFKFD